MGLKEILVFLILHAVSLWLCFMILLRTLYEWYKIGNEIFKIKARPVEPAIISDRRWGRHGYISLKKQGIKLHYVENGNREKPLMLCLHGFPECWFSWRHQLEAFSSTFWVVAADLRGYGDSDKPRHKSAYDIDTLVEDIHELVEMLKTDQLVTSPSKEWKCTLVAHDWGGALAWILVDQYPELFERHISLNAPHGGAFMNVNRKSPTQLKKSWYIAFFQTPWFPEFILSLQDLKVFIDIFRGPKDRKDAFPDEVIEAFKYYYSRKSAFKFPINYYRNISFTSVGKFGRIQVPTIIIWGTEDTALSKEIAIESAKYCDDIQLKFVDGASHWVQQEEPHYVNELIMAYCNITSKG